MHRFTNTLTSYGIAVIIVLAILNAIFWWVGSRRLHEAERVLCRIRPGDVRYVSCALAVWISPSGLFTTAGISLKQGRPGGGGQNLSPSTRNTCAQICE
jgi:hypothetical protein